MGVSLSTARYIAPVSFIVSSFYVSKLIVLCSLSMPIDNEA